MPRRPAIVAYGAERGSPVRAAFRASNSSSLPARMYSPRRSSRTPSRRARAQRRTNSASGVSVRWSAGSRRYRPSASRASIDSTRLPPPRLAAAVVVALVAEEVPARGQQERAELPLVLIDPGQCSGLQQRREEALSQVLPELYRRAACRSEALAVGAERHATDRAGMPFECEQLPAARGISELHRLIDTRRGDAPAVGAERHGHDVPGVPFEYEPLLATASVPDFDRRVSAARRKVPAIGAKCHARRASGRGRRQARRPWRSGGSGPSPGT